jgi:hypothetical protein
VGRAVVQGPLDDALLVRLFMLALGLLVLAWAWQLVMPLNKKIWSSSYVLLTTGLACAGLAALLRSVELRGARPAWVGWCEAHGRNALFVFVLSGFVPRVLALLRWEDGTDAQGRPRWITPLPWVWRSVFEPLGTWVGRPAPGFAGLRLRQPGAVHAAGDLDGSPGPVRARLSGRLPGIIRGVAAPETSVGPEFALGDPSAPASTLPQPAGARAGRDGSTASPATPRRRRLPRRRRRRPENPMLNVFSLASGRLVPGRDRDRSTRSRAVRPVWVDLGGAQREEKGWIASRFALDAARATSSTTTWRSRPASTRRTTASCTSARTS